MNYKAAEEEMKEADATWGVGENFVLSAQTCDTIISALRAMQERRARNQPCGCIICYCDDEIQCHGCGAKSCGKDDCVFKVGGIVMESASARGGGE